MNKKIIISVVILAIIVAIVGYIIVKNNGTENNEEPNEKHSTNEQNPNEQQNENKINKNETENNNSTNNKKTAVIYFSATGTTEKIANYISNETDADLIEIEPKEQYTSEDLNYNSDCRANREQNDSTARPEVANNIDTDKYDVIYLGYPIWWGDIPKIILTFLDNNNLNGKTVITFCTSGSTGISQSQSTLESYNKDINWIQGKRFSSSASEKEVTDWIETINL